MDTVEDDLALLRAHIASTALPMLKMPGGWPGNIELALIDAVLSIRARYGVTADTGVRGAIKRYREESGGTSWDDLRTLAGLDVAGLERILANRQKTGGVSKAQAIVSAAGRLLDVGVISADRVDRNSAEQRMAYCGTRGLGLVTWRYFLMLVGYDGVKPDTLVTRFVEQAIGRRADKDEVEKLVSDAARQTGVPAAALDHSIWRYMSTPRRD